MHVLLIHFVELKHDLEKTSKFGTEQQVLMNFTLPYSVGGL